MYLADAGFHTGVIVDAPLQAAVAALAGREAHVTHGAPGYNEVFLMRVCQKTIRLLKTISK